MQREVEREAIFSSEANPGYSKQILEKQSEELVKLREKIKEYETRDTKCEKHWTDLIKENEFNYQHALAYRSQVEKQRETYSKLLSVAEQRVINANSVIQNLFGESG